MKDLDRRLGILFIIQVTEILGFSLILPFLPFYAQEYGASPIMIGLILTVFSFFQFLSSPIMGSLSDTYGRRPLLMLSQFSTFVSFVILGFAQNLWMIFLSRSIDGLLGSNITIAQAYISDISSKKNRAKAFNTSNMAFGVGFLIGPAIGGWLSHFGYWLPAFIAAAISAISIVLTYFFLPETVVKKKTRLSLRSFKILDFKKLKHSLGQPTLGVALWQLFLFTLCHAVWTSNFALYGDLKFQLTPNIVGFLLAYVGFIGLLFKIILLPKLFDRFRSNRLIQLAIICICLGLIAPIIIGKSLLLLGAITLLSFGNGLMRPLLMSAISQSADSHEQGAVMGLGNSLGSIAQIVGPVFGGWLLSTRLPDSMLLVAVGIILVALLLNQRQARVMAP